MPIATDGFGTIIASLESGGGGGSVIPDGGTSSGTYEGNLVCEGDVTLTGNLTVNGSMIVLGTFTNDGGYEVTVRGDLHAQSINFDHADTSQVQQNFTVDGDLIFTYMAFRQSGGTAAQLRVGGDLIGSAGYSGTILRGEGVDGSLGVAGSPERAALIREAKKQMSYAMFLFAQNKGLVAYYKDQKKELESLQDLALD